MKHKILVVDDDHEDRDYLELILKPLNFQITSVENGEEAISEILGGDEKNICDLLITDIKMPLVDGVELIESLRSKNVLLPVIVVSGSVGPKVINKLTQHEDLDFMEKPVDEKSLLKKINQLL